MFDPPDCRLADVSPEAQILMRAIILEIFGPMMKQSGAPDMTDDQLVNSVDELMQRGYVSFKMLKDGTIKLLVAPELKAAIPFFGIPPGTA